MNIRVRVFLIVFTLFLGPLSAGTMKVVWDPVPGASGYNLYFGTASSSYTSVVDVGNATQSTLTINDCVDYYVSAKAYSLAGESVQFSNEVSGWAKPVVNTGGTINAVQGDQFTLDVSGANFQPGAQFQIDTSSIPADLNGNALVRVENPAILNCNQAQALVTIDPVGAGQRAMEVGNFSFNIEVVNPDGILGSRAANLVVNYDPLRSDMNRSDAVTKDRVDGKDLAWLAYAHGTAEGDARWNPDADLNGDGFVDGLDLALLATGFGQCWTGSGWSGTACP